jgi:hypothetical protein
LPPALRLLTAPASGVNVRGGCDIAILILLLADGSACAVAPAAGVLVFSMSRDATALVCDAFRVCRGRK